MTTQAVSETKRLIEKYQETFGDRYYLELQRFPELDRSTMLNQLFVDLSKTMGVETVATADVHYPMPGDNEMQRVLHATDRKSVGTVEAADASWEYDILLTYPTSDREVFDALARQDLTGDEAEAAVINTANIAARCERFALPKSKPVRYVSDQAPTMSAEQRLRQWFEQGMDHRYETDPKFAADYDARPEVYHDRAEREFSVLADKGFCDYFLVTADLCRYAKEEIHMAMGPGRGSAAGSLICYGTRITEINPMIKLSAEMQFERFIDPSRPDMPDIDLDFADNAVIFEYAQRKYGEAYVSHIGNFVRFRGKTAVSALAKVHQIDPFEVKEFTRLIVDRPDGDPRENDSVEDTIDSFDVAKRMVAKHPELRMATRLEGEYKTLSVHAAGMVISADPIEETCAVYVRKHRDTGEPIRVIAYDKRDAEYLNILKLDALGLKTLRLVQDVVDMVPELTMDHIYALDTDGQDVLREFARSADVTGIFQFDGRTTSGIVERVFANYRDGDRIEFSVLADINALSRPGALISGMTRLYEKVAQGRAEPRKYHPVVDAILADTNGCLIYQEQVMSIGREFGGFDGSKVGALRRIIGKKKAGGAFEEFFAEFAAGAKRLHDVDEPEARVIWDFMATSSSYLFNIAHAAAYAVIAYWSMYLKLNHPAQFYAAALRYAEKKKDSDQPLALMQDAVRHGIEVLPPDLALSSLQWTPEGDKAIRAGFQQIAGVGAKVGSLVTEWRDQKVGPPDSPSTSWVGVDLTWDDLTYTAAKSYKTRPDVPASGVPGFGPKTVAKIKEFVQDDDPFGIHTATRSCRALTRLISTGEAPLSMPTADAKRIGQMKDEDCVFVGLIREVRIIDVVEAERQRTNRSPDAIRAELRDPELTTKAKIVAVDQTGVETHVNIHRWLYPELKDDLAEAVPGVDMVHVEGLAREAFGPTVQAKAVVIIEPEAGK